MNSQKCIIFILIVILLFVIIYLVTTAFVNYQSIILYIFSKFDKGNFIIIDKNNNELLQVINEPNQIVPVVKVLNKSFFESIYSKSELGLGESYMRGEWVSDNIVEFLNTLCRNQNNPSIPSISLKSVFSTSMNYDKSNIKHHYDVGNDFYMKFLQDDLNAYSCGFWFSPTDTLNTAQYNKVNTIIKKLNAKPNSQILDIGCGWGTIANYVATQTNSKVTGITISDEQEKYGLENYNPNKVTIKNMDYRLLNGQYDCIYSIGMFEHVRYENYDIFFQTIKKCLKPGGRFVLHTIISFDQTEKIYQAGDKFVTTHIFPGGQIPNNDWILNKARANNLNICHFEGYGGQHYAKTLNNWRKLMWKESEYIKINYSTELLLKYDYYFASCESAFNTGMMGIGHYVIVSDPILSISNSFNY